MKIINTNYINETGFRFTVGYYNKEERKAMLFNIFDINGNINIIGIRQHLNSTDINNYTDMEIKLYLKESIKQWLSKNSREENFLSIINKVRNNSKQLYFNNVKEFIYG